MAQVGARLGRTIAAYQAAVDDFDREVARLLGVNETDIRCLEILLEEIDGVAPSLLATRLGLTTGSVTALLDRLEKLGYLTRSSHPTDRRKAIIRATDLAAGRAANLYAPLIEEGHRDLLSRYNTEQLELIIDFLSRATDLQQRHVQRLRTTTEGSTAQRRRQK